MENENQKSKDIKENKDDVLSKVALSRGMFFPSSEIFGENLSGLWDYGPLGLKIFSNILSEWRNTLYEINAVEISGSVILPRKVLQASGHEDNFFDVAVICEKCGSAYRVDKLLEEKEPSRNYEGLSDDDYLSWIKVYNIKCQKCGGNLTKIKKFGSMFGLEVGVQAHDGNEVNAYLRPEACQSIFLDFKRLFTLYGKRMPFIIAQVGKAFRNEISPRNSLIRQREFFQNDIEMFFVDDSSFPEFKDTKVTIYDKANSNISEIMISEALNKKIIENKITAYAVSVVSDFLNRLGFARSDIRLRKLYEDKAFYSKESFDVEVKKDSEWVELIACNYRSNYDLSVYKKYGGDIAQVGDKIPEIFEISAGTDRIFYMLLYNDLRYDSERRWFVLNGHIAPFKAAVFPLLSKDELVKFVNEHVSGSRYKKELYLLVSGNIGKMYRKADEIGVPIAITVDYQSLKDGTVTLRDRDSMEQFRFNVKDMDNLIEFSADNSFKRLREKFEAH